MFSRHLHEIVNYSILGIDGEIGRCKDFLFDDRHWTIRYMVVDTHKWLPGGKKVLVSPISLDTPNWRDQQLPVNLTREKIKNCPPLDEHQPVSQQYEKLFFNYYGYAYYWMGQNVWGGVANPGALMDGARIKSLEDNIPRERHLRSIEEVKGYSIQATDKSIGHIIDFIFDEKSWTLTDVVVDTRDWLPGGKKVLISPSQIKSVNWASRSLIVNMNEEQVQECPELS